MFAFLSRKPSPSVLDRLAAVEASQERLELLLDELKALYRRAIGRENKSTMREREETPREEPVAAAAGATVASVHGLLTPRQREVQQEILRRRAGG